MKSNETKLFHNNIPDCMCELFKATEFDVTKFEATKIKTAYISNITNISAITDKIKQFITTNYRKENNKRYCNTIASISIDKLV